MATRKLRQIWRKYLAHIDQCTTETGPRRVARALSSDVVKYPTDEATLRQFLQDARIDLQQMFDPWGINYRPVFSIEGRVDVF